MPVNAPALLAGDSPAPTAGLPPGWVASAPRVVDVDDLHDLVQRHEQVAAGRTSMAWADVDGIVPTSTGGNHGHTMVRDDAGRVRGWATVQDRAAGRVLVSVVVDPDLEPATADALAATLFDWAADASVELARGRGLELTQMDSGAFADDPRQQRWLAAAGFEHVRDWWQMSRPVTPDEAEAGGLPEPHESVVVRRVRRAGDGMPDAADLVLVHDVLEEAFEDHFNYRTESFDEFVSRLRDDPGHRWDHWWIAEVVEGDGEPRPAGALVGTVSHGEGSAPDSSYVAYLGVLRSARGRGVARSLLHAVIADAAARGRSGVGLEVDATSPTGAAELYLSTGFVTSHSTQSWHRDVSVTA